MLVDSGQYSLQHHNPVVNCNAFVLVVSQTVGPLLSVIFLINIFKDETNQFSTSLRSTQFTEETRLHHLAATTAL